MRSCSSGSEIAPEGVEASLNCAHENQLDPEHSPFVFPLRESNDQGCEDLDLGIE